MEWGEQQSKALLAVEAWLRQRGGQQVFRLFGVAGTGKSTLAREIAAMIGGHVQYCAFTGKAALVMKSKGCWNACTIHSLIYKAEVDENGDVHFVLNPASPASFAGLIIVDECSMLGQDLGMDLLSFGRKVLVLGDPCQLPPVRGEGFFTSATPDVMLTDIHRQAADNPIIRLSMDVRAGRPLKIGAYGTSKVITRLDLPPDEVNTANQVLVGMNRTRRAFNARIRELRRFTELFPMPGEKMVCLRNNREKGLLNGGLWTVISSETTAHDTVKMTVHDEDGGIANHVEVPIAFFEGREADLNRNVRRRYDEFDWGYVLTVHKYQGSESPHVLLFDESSVFREHQMNHLYTGITRAADRITIVI